MKRRVELLLERSIIVELEEGPTTSTVRLEGRTFVAERRELMRMDSSGELVKDGLVTSFELGDLDASARSVELTVFELEGRERDDHLRLVWRGERVSSHADTAGRRFRLVESGPPPRVRVGGPRAATLFWAKPAAKGFELCAAVGFASDAFLALDHESFASAPEARAVFDDGHEQRIALDERC